MGNVTINDVYNKEKVYKAKIQPLIKQIQIICIDEHIPMFFSCAVANDYKDTKYENEMVLAESGIKLKKNKISDCILTLNGAKTSPPRKVLKSISTIQEYLGNLVQTEELIDLHLYQDFINSFRCIMDGDFSFDFEKTLNHLDKKEETTISNMWNQD